ncbi:MAG: hypothetical protein Kow0098_07030 [Ignavibacteriaceae bacterium]
MLRLIPEWAHHYQAFWDAIRNRNLWLIKLRYGAVLMLALALFAAIYLVGFEFSDKQLAAVIIIIFSILLYNIFLHYVRRYLKCEADKFNPLHFSVVQMVLDLVTLTLLTYYTGGVETPLAMLFIFHMIVGSLILPGFVIYTLAVIVIITFSAIAYADYLGIIPHHHIQGLMDTHLSKDITYIITFTSVFAFTIIISVLLANRIAKQLYLREQQLYESLEKLNAAEKEKQKYIIGVVHEIKTPIAAIQSFLELIIQKFLGPLNEKVEEKLLRAKKRADEALEMTNEVLKISRLRLLDEVSNENILLDEVIETVINKHQSSADIKNIKIDYLNQVNKALTVTGDKFLLGIAFSNIISNAVRYIPEGGKIEIRVTENSGNIKVVISDNGIGIPPGEEEKIFGDFFRGSNIRDLAPAGTGLGLSAVKQIITRHGGTVKAKSPSAIGNSDFPGSEFIIFLPIRYSNN